jgi:carbamoyltransferase
MNHIGISCGFHDAGLSVVDSNGGILFAGHSERYSRNKHDSSLCVGIVEDSHNYINDDFQVHYYERPLVKAIRQFKAGQSLGPFRVDKLIGPSLELLNRNGKTRLGRVKTHNHHLCHAASGFQTSTFDHATVVIIDAIGELDTVSIWDAKYNKFGVAEYKKLWGKTYPNSIGLFYSAMTQRVGLKPLDEEYILMGMSAYGKPMYTNELEEEVLINKASLDFRVNLHAGLSTEFLKEASDVDIAASTQEITESLIQITMSKAARIGKSENLVYGGGVALNCLANRLLGKLFRNIWIFPNPGDAGNALGAAALGYGKKLDWKTSFLGYDIDGAYPIQDIINELKTNKMVGVASGRAEFGPRALGNRSLLADPRGTTIKDKVNEIKRRQKFRPFAPVILEEMANDYFDIPCNWNNSRYMQVISSCRHPTMFPAIVHADMTSRVQTVPKDGSGIRRLLELWYADTNCPMLLNTSLNIRGEPMVNTRDDAMRFEKLYNLKVCT